MMKKGRASRTAELVCVGRAFAHGASSLPRYQDPTALALLPDDARARVERALAGEVAKGLRAQLKRTYLVYQSKMMVVRTVAIDDAIRTAATPQLVILGAGLDGRAFRMSELREVTVFEVDHPDSQREKRARAARLTQVAHDLRFVPVDFERDSLDSALSNAGHDPTKSTTWVWEGVVMYLALKDIRSSLQVIQRRSAPGSTLVIVYHSPSWILRIVSALLRGVGEPLRSAFTAASMRELLEEFGFRVLWDKDLPTLAREMSGELFEATKRIGHLRLVAALHGESP